MHMQLIVSTIRAPFIANNIAYLYVSCPSIYGGDVKWNWIRLERVWVRPKSHEQNRQYPRVLFGPMHPPMKLGFQSHMNFGNAATSKELLTYVHNNSYVLHDTSENYIRKCFIMRDPSPHNAINYATKNFTLISAKISTQW